MSGVKINNIVKRSISLSPLVNQWAEELAEKRGFGTNFSAFLADLVRRAQEGDVNSANVAALSESSISDAAPVPVPGSPATGALPPVSYRSTPKAPRRSKSRPTPDASKKAP